MTIQGALTDLRNLLNADDIPCYYKPSIKKIIETIEQEPKTGHWIEQQTVSLNNHKIMWFECSECGHKETNPLKMYQCEVCGAKMKSEVEE